MTDKKFKSEQEEHIEQVDVQSVCNNLDMGRYQIIELAAYVARQLDLRPHDALKKLLEVDDLEEFLKSLKEKEITREFRQRF
tara:strand:+ start:775 stop:1020 length:246 start_codon:yes stop_codon:yes gene_type:complete